MTYPPELTFPDAHSEPTGTGEIDAPSRERERKRTYRRAPGIAARVAAFAEKKEGPRRMFEIPERRISREICRLSIISLSCARRRLIVRPGDIPSSRSRRTTSEGGMVELYKGGKRTREKNTRENSWRKLVNLSAGRLTLLASCTRSSLDPSVTRSSHDRPQILPHREK